MGSVRLRSLRTMPRSTAGMLIVSLLSLPVLSVVASGVRLEGVIALHWILALIVIGFVLQVETEPLTSIGFRKPAWIDLGYLLGTTVVALLIFMFASPFLEIVGLPPTEGTAVVETEAGFAVVLAWAITVGIVEEILYRGYAIERLLDYSKRPLVAGGITWIVFTLAHVVIWPVGNLIQTSAVTAVFIIVYLRRRTLVPVAGAHVLIWVLAVFEQFFA